MNERMICGLIIGDAGAAKKARELARAFRDCPHTALVGAFGTRLIWALFLPESYRGWWLEPIAEDPAGTLGLQSAEVLVTEAWEITYPEFRPRIPAEKLEICPCGARCDLCDLYGRCPGCPATIFYRGVRS